jgi:ubiquinone/menaquinone biosynthesis C-methylase UbiE
MSLHDRVEFWFISFIHDKLYSLSMNPKKLLLPAGLKEGDYVLEVGCGPGFFTLPSAEIVGDKGFIYAIDINPFAIRKVKKKIAKAGVKNVKAMIVDVTETTLKDSSIDLAFFFGVIHSLYSIINRVILEMHRILKDEGIIAIQKSGKSKDCLVDIITQNNKFKFIEEKKSVLVFQKIE